MKKMQFKSILAIGAHPDDIEFSCFGFLLKQQKKGCNIYVFIASPDSRSNGSQDKERIQESINSFSLIPNCIVKFRNTNKILTEDYENLSDQIRDIVLENNIDLVLIHSAKDDTHQEHRLLHDMTISALRRLPINIIEYRSPSIYNGFKTNYIVDIENEYSIKMDAIRKHITQSKMSYMSTDSIKIFNQPWTAKLHNISYAEEFNIIRMVG